MPGHEITPEVEKFLASQPNLILATLRRPSGEVRGPQLSPVWYIWRDGAFFISTTTATAKWKNLLRDPHCSGIVDHHDGHYVYVAGVAELDDGDVYDLTREIIRRYKTPEEFRPYMESIYERGNRGLIRLIPQRIVTREFD